MAQQGPPQLAVTSTAVMKSGDDIKSKWQNIKLKNKDLKGHQRSRRKEEND
jgi:hypothetical protein